jgi:hypothetical protein
LLKIDLPTVTAIRSSPIFAGFWRKGGCRRLGLSIGGLQADGNLLIQGIPLTRTLAFQDALVLSVGQGPRKAARAVG